MKSLIVAGAVSALTMLGGVSQAHAISDGDVTTCSHYDETLCLFYNSNLAGAHVGIYGLVNNYDVDVPDCQSEGCPTYEYLTSGSGELQNVKNNSASVYNENSSSVYQVFYNSNEAGSSDLWDPEGYGTFYGNLVNTYNENASQDCQCSA
ncbi:hypothetical protein [Streptacidiphilus sp. BW17]|uniref:hypothetical protein n=1 Tax=Streptacidiphilus sp. BW17 TaxID=3156274 RepID=UPI0035153281